MKTVFRWFGEKDDSVTLGQIRQIPGVKGVVGALQDIPVGDVWPVERIAELKSKIGDAGLEFEVVESVNVHEDIKLGLPSRERYIDNYKDTIANLGKAGIKVICYNFMPVFDWTRTELKNRLDDGSAVLAYEDEKLKDLDPIELVDRMEREGGGFSLPGWEPYRLKELKTLFEKYREVGEEDLFGNLEYFLRKIMPVCEENGVKMAIHPDDPPWPVFGLPRVVKSQGDLQRIVDAVDSPCNGLTVCTGSLGVGSENDLPRIIRHFGEMGRVHFVHVRNVRVLSERKFHETSHLSSEGSIDVFEIMKTLHDLDFDGYVRPDHGRMIWGETGRPGYGLYDRALGVAYLNGLTEAIEKMQRKPGSD